ncbi:hypothetical protein L1049_008844 [Liquidambar formosana]|uniref:Uncharacterized protein n=1 Tax=Liquidambar formosana TaxID=63359 RepID=A0AAP0SAG2_LIQFO
MIDAASAFTLQGFILVGSNNDGETLIVDVGMALALALASGFNLHALTIMNFPRETNGRSELDFKFMLMGFSRNFRKMSISGTYFHWLWGKCCGLNQHPADPPGEVIWAGAVFLRLVFGFT